MLVVAVLTGAGQVVTQRDPDPIDVLRDGAGIAAGLGLYALTDLSLSSLKQRHRLLQPALAAAVVFVLAAAFYPLLDSFSASLQRYRAFPLVADFRAGWTRAFLRLNRASLARAMRPESCAPAESGTEDCFVLLPLNPGKYSGVSIVEPYPDWSGYSVLGLDLYSAHARSVNLVIRIHDDHHNQAYDDRFNRSVMLRPGNNRIQIPLRTVAQAPAGRAMDMQRIAGLMLFAVDVDAAIRLYPGLIRLE